MRGIEDDPGPSVVNGVLRRTSVSQVTSFDPESYGGCNRRWYFENVRGMKSADTNATRTGKEVHEQIEHFLKTGEDVLGMIARQGKHWIPRPDPRYLIEHRFGTRATVLAYDRMRLGASEWGIDPLTREHVTKGALVAADVPFIGYIDLVNPTGMWLNNEGETKLDPPGMIELCDWKTSSSIENYGKKAHDLPNTVQMIGYARWAHLQYPNAEQFRLSHGYMQTRGRAAEKRSVLIPLATVNERWQTVVRTVQSMRDVAREVDAMKVDPNYDSCGAYRGCPHRSLCPRSPEKVFTDLFGGKDMSLLKKLQSAASGSSTSATSGLSTPQGHIAPAPDTVREPLVTPEQLARSKAGHRDTVTPEVYAELQRLKAEERGECAVDGAKLTPENSAKLPTGEVKHIGCVVPPDAPKSAAPDSAIAVPLESKATLAPELARLRREFEKTATATAEQTTTGGRRRGPRKPKNDEVAVNVGDVIGVVDGAGNVEPAVVTETGIRALSDDERRAKLRQGSVFNEVVRAAADEALKDPRFTTFCDDALMLYVDVVITGGLSQMPPLEPWIAHICSTICEEYSVGDMRFAPHDSVLGYGKWKGALAAAIRAAPPPPGMYTLRGVRESELKQVVLEALEPLCSAVVRGIS